MWVRGRSLYPTLKGKGTFPFLPLFCLVWLTCSVTSYPYAIPDLASDGGEELRLVRRQEEGPPDPNIRILEELANRQLLNHVEWFSDDLLLAQRLDRINDISKYTDPENNSTVIFERNVVDYNKKIVVLSGSEDRRSIPSNIRKRTYIVLVQAPPDPDTKYAHYAMIFAYLRDARPGDSNVQNAGGKQVTVEWDVWDARVLNPALQYGWSSCTYTILFSCQINETAIAEIVNKLGPNGGHPAPPKPSTDVGSTDINEVIVADGGVDSNEYVDLYGDYDVIGPDGKGKGRSLFSSAAAPAAAAPAAPAAAGCHSGYPFGLFSTASCPPAPAPGAVGTTTTTTDPATGKTKKVKIVKKIVKVNASSSAAATSWIPGFQSGTPLAGAAGSGKPSSNADAVFGTYYKGLTGTPPIFIPDGGDPIAVLFIPDKESYTIRGTYTPGQAGYPDTFTPDNPSQTANVFGVSGTQIPNAMTKVGVTGGIHGQLTGDSFKPDNQGTAMWFNPDGTESKGVFSTYKKPAAPTRPKTTAAGEAIIYGVEFPGVAGSPDIFIPDGQAIPGIFVPNDPAHPEVVSMPHASFVATKPAGHGNMYPDNPKEAASITQVRGAFMPDGMNLTGAISGLATKEGSTFVFVVDVPGLDHTYIKSTASINMWAPFLKPGEWMPKPAAQAAAPPPPPSAVEAAKKKKLNQAFMFGVKFGSMSNLEVFIPDDFPVEGQMIPADADKYKPIQGQLTGVGKTPEKLSFHANEAAAMAGISAMPTMFVPDGIAPGNGVMGTLTSEGATATYVPDPPGKGYWYIKGKPENAKVWTPFTPPFNPPKPSMAEKVEQSPFKAGIYYQGGGNSREFVPDNGGVGCFYPDGAPRSCGIFYPPKGDIPAEFVEDVGGLAKDGQQGTWVAQLEDGTESKEKIRVTFVAAKDPNPAVLNTDALPSTAWVQSPVKVQSVKEDKRISAAAKAALNASREASIEEAKHPSNVAVPVGGGFSGYPTNNKGLESMVDPLHPVFKEFILYKDRQDKNIQSSDLIMIVASKPDQLASTTYYITFDEYKAYLDERYMLKTTHIKTLEFEARLEIAIPKAAEKYVKKKKGPMKIKLDVMSAANAGAGAGAGGGPGGDAKGMGSGGVKGTKGGKECKGGWSSSATAVAQATNGSSSTAKADSIQGGDSHALSLSKDGGNATSAAKVNDGGQANAMSLAAAAGTKAGSEANAAQGGMANAISRKIKENSTGEAVANAKRIDAPSKDADCSGEGAMPDEIEVDSHAAATALAGNGNGTGNTVNSVANTNVKIDMAGLVEKVMAMQKKNGDDDEDDDQELHIAINAQAASSGSAAGRSLGVDDLDSQSDKMKKVANLGKAAAQAGVKISYGWKTELRKIKPNVTLEFESEVFYGLGNCPYSPIDPPPNDPEKVIDYYVQKLRLDCNDRVKPRVLKLFNNGVLNFDESMNYFIIPPNNELLKQPKITDADLRRLSAAFEFSIFSETYHSQRSGAAGTGVAPYEAPDVGIPPATRSVRFITELALNAIERSRKIAPSHYVRLTRNLLSTLRTIMLKLVQDGVAVSGCNECGLDKSSNDNDQLHLMGLLEFVIHGIVNYEKGVDKDLRSAFKQFLILNKKAIDNRKKVFQKTAPQ